VSGFCACIGSPCLRHCVHGASIGGARSRAAAAAAEVRGARCHAAVLTENHLCHPCSCQEIYLEDPTGGAD
jgi:hypothetical protein